MAIIRLRGTSRSLLAFTVVEMLIAIAIIAMLSALLVPVIGRSLGKNRLANDAEMFRSKLEEVRLLAGSTQGGDESTFGASEVNVIDEVGHYAMLIPAGSTDYFAIVRLSEPVSPGNIDAPPSNYCPATLAITHADPSSSVSGDRFCLVERIDLSSGVDLVSSDNRLVAFKVPSKQINEISKDRDVWKVSAPLFNWEFNLTSSGKTARVVLGPFTANVVVTYSTDGGER